MPRVEDTLRQAGLKATGSRRRILFFLKDNHGPFTIAEIHAVFSELDIVTIYRCLDKLEEKKLVDRCDFGDQVIRYEFRHGHHHHHVICHSCKDVVALPHCPVDVTRLASLGYKDISHKLEFFGLCPRCQ